MECRKLAILGAGGFGREVLFLLLDINEKYNRYDILGFIDNDPELKGKMVNGFPVLGGDSWLLNYSDDINVVVCVGNSKSRRQSVEKFINNKNIYFPNIIADNVKYSGSVSMGKGCIICFSSILTVNIKLGDFVIINFNCTVAHDASLSDFVTLHPGVSISGGVLIGTNVLVGTSASIIQYMNIGDNSVIGAGSVVMREVPSNCTVLGIPARRIN